MRSRLLRVWVLCWLMLVWVLLWGKATPANIIGGFAVALVITLLLPLPAVPVEGRVHPLSLAAADRRRRLPAGAVLPAGGLAGHQTGAAAAHRGAARPARDQVGSGAGAGRQHLQPDSRLDGVGDRPGAAADLRARHRRRQREGRRPLLPTGRADRAPAGGGVRARRGLAAVDEQGGAREYRMDHRRGDADRGSGRS